MAPRARSASCRSVLAPILPSLELQTHPSTRPAVRRPSRPSYSTTAPATTRSPRRWLPRPVFKTSLPRRPTGRPAASARCRPTRSTRPPPQLQPLKSIRSSRPYRRSVASVWLLFPLFLLLPRPRQHHPTRLGSRSRLPRLLCQLLLSQSRPRRRPYRRLSSTNTAPRTRSRRRRPVSCKMPRRRKCTSLPTRS